MQIRRSSYHDAVRAEDIQNDLDISGIQTYVINSFNVVFLNKRDFDNPKTKSYKYASGCQTCRRNILDSSTFCSLGCKVDLSHSFMPPIFIFTFLWMETIVAPKNDATTAVRFFKKNKFARIDVSATMTESVAVNHYILLRMRSPHRRNKKGLQYIRRSSYHDVVRAEDFQNDLDISGIQTYVINNFNVVFLNKRDCDNPKTKSYKYTSRCQTRRRNILDSYFLLFGI
ncbi:hypothetical protein CR513_38092, partial [Mucuna pruriens]